MRRDMYNPGDDGSKGSAAKITVDIGSGLVTNESGGTDTFTVALDLAPTADVTFPLASGDTGEVTVSPSGITFTTANWSTPRVVTVQGVPDGVADGHMPVAVLIGAASSADPNWSGFDPADVTVYNIDEDSASTPGVTVSVSGTLLLSEIGTSGSFAVVLNSQPTAGVSIPVTVSDGTEATITSPFGGTSGTLVFTSMDWNTPQVVLVTGVNDFTADGNYAGTVYVGAASSADPLYFGYEPPDVSFTTVDDDAAGVTVSADPTVYVSESFSTGSFTVVLNSQPTGDVVMTVAVSDATEGVLVAPASGTLTFSPAAWDVPQTVTVKGVNDSEADGTVSYPVYVTMNAAATLDGAYDFIDPSDVNFATIDNDAAGVTVSAVTSALVSESGTDSSFTIVLNSQPTGGVTINISVPDTSEGTITAPVPGGSSQLLTFTPLNWSAAQTVTVAGVNDVVADGNVGFNVIIGPTASSDSDYSGTFNPPDIVLTNVDDDKAGVTVTAGTTMVTESGTTASFAVVLNSQPTANVSLSFSIDDATEGVFLAPFAGTAGSVTFTSSDWSTAKTVTLCGVNDGVSDGHQSFRVNFGATSSGDSKYGGTFTPPSIFFTCIDDMGGALVPGVAVLALDDPLVVSESGASASFQVVLTAPPIAAVDIPVSVGDTSEGLITSPAWGAAGTITFTPFNWNIPYKVTVTGQDDASADGSQDFWLILGTTSCPPDPPYHGLPVQDVQCRCIDDDGVPGVTVIAGPEVYVSESGTSASFKVVLNTAPSDVVVIDAAVDDPSEGVLVAPVSGTLTFNPSNWDIPQTVTVQGVDDQHFDGNTGFYAVLGMNTPGTLDGSYDPINPDDVYFVNIDDDAAGVTVSTGSYYMVSEGGTYCAFEVILNSKPSSDVGILVSIDDPSEGGLITPASGSLIFTAANWDIPQTVAAGGMDDPVADGNQTFTVVLGATSSADLAYNGTFDPDDVSFLNVDDDTPGITVNIGDGLITKEDPVTPLSDTFTVVLNSQPKTGETVTIGPIASSNVAEVVVMPGSLIFDSANWNIPKTVIVQGVDDLLWDNEQYVTIDLGTSTSGDPLYNGIAPADAAVTNIDDDAQPSVIILSTPSGFITTENGAAARIQVVLSNKPTANVVLSGIASADPGEGTVSPASLTFTPAAWDCPQTVTVTPVNDGFVDGDVVYFVGFGVTASADWTWSGVQGGSRAVTNMDFVTMCGVNPYTRSVPTPTAFTSISGGGSTDLTATFRSVEPATYFDYDEGYSFAPLGFTFYYMGMPFNDLKVYSNGFAAFNSYINIINNFSNDYLYTTGSIANEYINILAPWWDDFELMPGTDNPPSTGRVWYRTTGSAPNRVFTLEWNAMRVAMPTTSDDTFTFQLRLFESTNVIEFHYGPKSNADSTTNQTSASCGIKDGIGGDNHFIEARTGVIDNSPTIGDWTIAQFPALNTIYRFTP
jgi:hypothetical protein